jgi:hypothetical protein
MKCNFFSFLLIILYFTTSFLLNGNIALFSSVYASDSDGGPLILRADKKWYDQGQLATFELENRANKTLTFSGSNFGLKITNGDTGVVFYKPTEEVNSLNPEEIRIIKWKIPDSELEPGNYTATVSSTGFSQPEESGSGKFSATVTFNTTGKMIKPSLLTSNSLAGFTSYEDTPAGIKILYPINATVYHTITRNDGINSSFISFRNLGPMASLNLIIKQLQANATLDEYSSTKMDEIKKWNNTALTMSGIGGLKIIESAPVTISESLPAHKVVYECPCFPDTSILKRMEVWTIKDGRAYDITYEAFPDTYTERLDTAQKMIDSFEITR